MNRSLSQEYYIAASFFIDDICSCDIDIDNDPDLVVCSNYNGIIPDTIYIFYNDGFGNLSKSMIARTNRLQIRCGNIDDDQYPDIVTSGSGSIIYIKNNGDGTFGEEIGIAPSQGYRVIDYIVDMNDNGQNDLVYSYSNMYEKWGILNNVGNLNFTDYVIYNNGVGGKLFPRIGNLNADDLPDVSMAFIPIGTHILFNNGDFTFDSLQICSIRCHEIFPLQMNLSDQDDIILFSTNTDELILIENLGNEQFTDRDTLPLIGPVMVTDIADFNNDGYDDYCYALCYWTGCTDSLYVSINNQQWDFLAPQQYYVGPMEIFSTESADLNGDNFNDIILFGYYPRNAFKILWNDGLGGFSYENPVGIKEPQKINKAFKVVIKPNPFNFLLHISLISTTNSKYTISIIDLYGRQVRSFETDSVKSLDYLEVDWDCKDFSGQEVKNGIYFLSISDCKNNIQTFKIIKY
jgi:hypothetical protein